MRRIAIKTGHISRTVLGALLNIYTCINGMLNMWLAFLRHCHCTFEMGPGRVARSCMPTKYTRTHRLESNEVHRMNSIHFVVILQYYKRPQTYFLTHVSSRRSILNNRTNNPKHDALEIGSQGSLVGRHHPALAASITRRRMHIAPHAFI